MKFNLFEQVALQRTSRKKISDAETWPPSLTAIPPLTAGSLGGELGYSIEVFNAIGETIAVPCVPESCLERLTADEILHVRPLTESGAFRS